MEKQVFHLDKIINRLQHFGYRYRLKDTNLKIYLPLLCYLRIDFGADKLKITSHYRLGFRPLSLEFNFLIYGLILILLSGYRWETTEPVIFIFLGILLIYFVICIIKTENLKKILHIWMENDNIKTPKP